MARFPLTFGGVLFSLFSSRAHRRTAARLEELRKTTGKGWSAVPDAGDAAYFQDRSKRYAELYARRGPHAVTVQLSVPTGQSVESMRPAAVALAKALVAKLP